MLECMCMWEGGEKGELRENRLKLSGWKNDQALKRNAVEAFEHKVDVLPVTDFWLLNALN